MAKRISKDRKEHIRQKVQDGLCYLLESYGVVDIIENLDGLSEDEKVWAKDSIDWQLVILK